MILESNYFCLVRVLRFALLLLHMTSLYRFLPSLYYIPIAGIFCIMSLQFLVWLVKKVFSFFVFLLIETNIFRQELSSAVIFTVKQHLKSLENYVLITNVMMVFVSFFILRYITPLFPIPLFALFLCLSYRTYSTDVSKKRKITSERTNSFTWVSNMIISKYCAY